MYLFSEGFTTGWKGHTLWKIEGEKMRKYCTLCCTLLKETVNECYVCGGKQLQEIKINIQKSTLGKNR